MNDLKDFIDRHYPTIFMAAARLTGFSDQEELTMLTENVLASLWKSRQSFDENGRPGVFLYKILLYEVFSYLKKRGDEERIKILRDILLIDPALYLSDLPQDPPTIS